MAYQTLFVTGLKIFGIESRPLHKVLEFNHDLNIPGITGSESGTIQFLQDLGIYPKKGNGWKRFSDLTTEEVQRLYTAIILKKEKQEDIENIFGKNYIMLDEKDSVLRDAREFSTVLNACGRLNKASLGIGTCIGDEKLKQKAITTLKRYKSEIVRAIQWYKSNDKTENIIKGKGYVIINAKGSIMHTIIGTLSSIISKGKEYPEGTYIMSMAKNDDNEIKVSLRVAGRANKTVDLRKIMAQILHSMDEVETGGHKSAAGAIIPLEKEERFIEIAEQVLAKNVISKSSE